MNPAALYWAIVIGNEARITGEHFENVEKLKTMSDNDGRTDGLKWVEEETFAHPWAGHSMNRCGDCGIAFVGDKRAVNCLACAWKAFTERGAEVADLSQRVDSLCLDVTRLATRAREAEDERDALRAQLAAIHARAEQLQAEADWPEVVLEQLEGMKGERDAARADLALEQELYRRLSRSITARCEIHASYSQGCVDCRIAQIASERDAARADREAILEFVRESFRADARLARNYEEGWNDAFATMLEKIEKVEASGAPLLAELTKLRSIASLAAAFCAETVGEEEASENGRRLNEAVRLWEETAK